MNNSPRADTDAAGTGVRVVETTPAPSAVITDTLERVGVTVEVPRGLDPYVAVYLGPDRVAARHITNRTGRVTVTATVNRTVTGDTPDVGRVVIIDSPVENASSVDVHPWTFDLNVTRERARPPLRELMWGAGRSHGLSDSALVGLFSRDVDDDVNNSTASNRNLTSYQEIGAMVDVAYERPPALAREWTAGDSRHLEERLFESQSAAADRQTSYYPQGADLVQSAFISDAHATIFGIHPGTVVHDGRGPPMRYVAPNGTVRGVVDFRVWTPESWTYREQRPNGTFRREFSYSVRGTGIDGELWVKPRWYLGTRLAAYYGHVQRLRYERLNDQQSDIVGEDETDPLIFQSEISVDLELTVTTWRPLNESKNNTGAVRRNGEAYNRSRSVYNISDTASPEDRAVVRAYDPEATLRHAVYPDGTERLGVRSRDYIDDIRLNSTTGAGVDGIWWYYTAHHRQWASLVRSTGTSHSVRPSPGFPMSVHAYPARSEPRLRSGGLPGADLTRVWGTSEGGFSSGIGEHVNMTPVDEALVDPRCPQGLVAPAGGVGWSTLRIGGLVNGTSVAYSRPEPAQVRETRIEQEVLERTDDGKRVLLTPVDATTGDPIGVVENRTVPPARSFCTTPSRSSRPRLVVGDREFTPREYADGVAVTITESGFTRVEFSGVSWVDKERGFTRSSSSVKFAPVLSGVWWLELFTAVVFYLGVPFAFLYYLWNRGADLLRPDP